MNREEVVNFINDIDWQPIKDKIFLRTGYIPTIIYDMPQFTGEEYCIKLNMKPLVSYYEYYPLAFHIAADYTDCIIIKCKLGMRLGLSVQVTANPIESHLLPVQKKLILSAYWDGKEWHFRDT